MWHLCDSPVRPVGTQWYLHFDKRLTRVTHLLNAFCPCACAGAASTRKLAQTTVPIDQCDTTAKTCPVDKPLHTCCNLDSNTCDTPNPDPNARQACIGAASIVSGCCPAPTAGDSTPAQPTASPTPDPTQQADTAGPPPPSAGQPVTSPVPDPNQTAADPTQQTDSTGQRRKLMAPPTTAGQLDVPLSDGGVTDPRADGASAPTITAGQLDVPLSGGGITDPRADGAGASTLTAGQLDVPLSDGGVADPTQQTDSTGQRRRLMAPPTAGQPDVPLSGGGVTAPQAGAAGSPTNTAEQQDDPLPSAAEMLWGIDKPDVDDDDYPHVWHTVSGSEP